MTPTTSAGGDYSTTFVIYKKLNLDVAFNAGAAGTIGDITSGSLYIQFSQNRNILTANPFVKWTARVRYTAVGGPKAPKRLDGGDYLTLYSQSTAFTAQTVIAVVNLAASGNVGARVFNQVSAGGNDYDATGHYIPIRRASSLTTLGGYAGGGDRSTVTNANGAKSLIVARHSGTAIVNRINGVDGSSYSHTLNYTPQRMRLFSNLNAANDNPGETGAGTYFELLVFSTALSTTDRAALETYLNAKWSIY